MGHISCSAAIVGLRYGGVASAATLAEKLEIHDHGADQQIVGISTKCPAWNWVIRRNSIGGAGPGQYLGNSDGSAEFVNGLIERNLVRDSIGYAMQIKHQNVRTTGIGEPASNTTIIRHNVFSKGAGFVLALTNPVGATVAGPRPAGTP
jgi:hypothetical protein